MSVPAERAERATLGAVITDSRLLALVPELRPDDFATDEHAVVFVAIRTLAARGDAVDLVTVTQELERTGRLNRAGGQAYVSSLLDGVADCDNVATYANAVRDAARGRQLAADLNAQAAALADGARPEDVAENVQRAARAVAVEKDAARTLPTFSAVTLDGMTLPEPRYACADLVVEGLSFLAGKPKLGKSWLALQLAIAICLAETWLGKKCEHGEVLYLALEDSKRRLQERVRIVLDRRRVPPGLTFATECPRLDAGGLDLISSWLEAHSEARLVIIDTLGKVKPIRKRGGDVYAEDADAGSRLQALAFKHHVAVLVVTHTRKAGADDFLEAVSGTLGLTGAADSVLVLKRDRGAAEGTLSITGRDIDECEFALSFARGTLWTALGDAADVPVSNERRDVLEVLHAAGRDSSRSPAMGSGEIAKALGKSPKAVSHLLTRMRADGQVYRGMKYGTWLPGGSLELPLEVGEGGEPPHIPTSPPSPPSISSTTSTTSRERVRGRHPRGASHGSPDLSREPSGALGSRAHRPALIAVPGPGHRPGDLVLYVSEDDELATLGGS